MTVILGLTGGIASGKSTADEFFKKKNIPIVDADKIAHHIYDKDQTAYSLVVDKFGKKILAKDQSVDRKKFGQIVFSDVNKLHELNKITHPFILKEIKQQLRSQSKNHALVIADIPLLFESHGENLCDKILVISIPEKLQIQRLMARNNLTAKEARERINSQMPLAEKVKKATYVVDNAGTIEELEEKLNKILDKIKLGE